MALVDIYNETRMTARSFYVGPSESASKDFAKQDLYLDNRLANVIKVADSDSIFDEFKGDIIEFSKLINTWYGHIDSLRAIYADENYDAVKAAEVAFEAR